MKTDYKFIIDLDKPSNRQRQRDSWVDFPTVLEMALQEGLEDFNERLHAKLLENMSIYGVDKMGLAETIDIQTTDEGISIRMSGEHALFIEYGTGLNGTMEPHPMANSHGWFYMDGDVSGREGGDGGWFYPTVEGDPNPWKHMYKGRLYGWTKGLPSRPFMYTTWLWGVQSINNILNGHINRAMKKVGAR